MLNTLPTTLARHTSVSVIPTVLIRSFATETVTSSSPDVPPLPPHKHPPSKSTKPRLYPQPRPPAPSVHHPALARLPPSFGRNQFLPVSNSTRALLESIVARFNAPIRYAFAYGSGVFEQDGYQGKDGNPPMLDFMFAVTHPAHFHSINMHQFPGHYPLHSRVLGSSYVAKVEDISPGVWFNTYVPMNDTMIKYGVTTVDNLCSDLLNWKSLYLAGRMHKPLRIIKDDARVRLTQQVNLTSAVRAALLTLPEEFTETQLFERIAGISYAGDPRMLLPAENRGKVGNIVRKQGPQFKELYHRLVVALPGTHWPMHANVIQQDISARARSAHLRKLPENLLGKVKANYRSKLESAMELEKDESAYWVQLAGDERLREVIAEEMTRIVRGPAAVQSLKGLVSAGLTKSVRYSAAKIGKWWSGSRSES